jgi:hypothetical protein
MYQTYIHAHFPFVSLCSPFKTELAELIFANILSPARFKGFDLG